MNSLVLSTVTRLLAPLLLVFSIFVLLRGHNEPGGGFIGGLLAAIAFILINKAEGTRVARRALRMLPLTLAGLGLSASLVAGFWGLFAGGSFLQGIWPLISVQADGSKAGIAAGSILLFDIGVYLVVIGAVTGIYLALEDGIARSLK
ncbi:MAG: MnhB domain-containing protein [Litorivicinus sp.]